VGASSGPKQNLEYRTALYGTYMNWVITTLGEIFGTAANSPISAVGHSGQPWQESLVATGFLSVAVAIVTCSALVLWGLRARAMQSKLDVSA